MPDHVKAVFDLLKDNWTSANTNELTPIFYYGEIDHATRTYSDTSRIDASDRPQIKVYEGEETILEPNGLGTAAQRETYQVKIDIRTLKSRAHALLLVGEVRRILNNRILTTTSFDTVDADGMKDESNNNKGLWRFTLTYKLMRYNASRSL